MAAIALIAMYLRACSSFALAPPADLRSIEWSSHLAALEGFEFVERSRPVLVQQARERAIG